MGASTPPYRLRFGLFEIDRRTGEVRRQGVRIKVAAQPFQVLSTLLERPGELVTREELRERLWPSDTFVDFEHSLNSAVKKLRLALGDMAEAPAFIETLPRRGYRFAGAVEEVRGDEEVRLAVLPFAVAPAEGPGAGLGIVADPDEGGPRRRRAHDPQAYTEYLEGRHHLAHRTIERVGRAIEKFERAIQRDGGYALAYAGLAEAHTLAASAEYGGGRWAESMARAKAAAVRALALDEGLSQAHAALALVHFRLDWNWALAEAEFRRALALNPHDADVHHAFAFYLIAMERRAEACAEAAESYRLQPVSPIIATGLGRILHFAGEDDRAIEQFQRVRELEPSFAQAWFDLALAQARQGRLDEAIEGCRTAIALSPGRPVCNAVLGNCLARGGRPEEARDILGDLERLVGARQASPFDLALVFTGLGDGERAIEALRAACRERHGLLVYLRVEPLWDPLRGDPRFGELLREVGLVPSF